MTGRYTDEDDLLSGEESEFTLTNGSSTSYLQLDSEQEESYRLYRQHRPRVRREKKKTHRHDSKTFETDRSFSTIPAAEVSCEPDDMKEVYLELQEINSKLKAEFRILQDRGLVLKEKEKSLASARTDFDRLVEDEVNRRLGQKQQEFKSEVEKMDQLFKDKVKENKRLKDNFDTVKSVNDTIRKELETLQTQHDKLEKQHSSLQARLSNLQRKHEFAERKDELLPIEVLKSKKQSKDVKETKPSKQLVKPCVNTYEVLGVILEWISEVHLRHTVSEEPSKPLEDMTSSTFIQEKCYKVLPSLIEILKEVPSSNHKFVLPCLQFIYWSLLHVDVVNTHQKVSFSSTLRRLGEELYRPRTVKFTEEEPSSTAHLSLGSPPRPDKGRETMFFRSNSLHVRFLSSLVILKTNLQVDHLANVFEVMRSDLKSDTGRELFLHYRATPVFIPYLKASNKALTNCAVDVFLQMSMDWPSVTTFLDTCSTETWFRQASMVFRMPNAEHKLVEKLSIILQKLSKNRNNRKYFEVFGLTSSCQEMSRTSGPDNAFLALNLKSILFNLATKPISIVTRSHDSS